MYKFESQSNSFTQIEDSNSFIISTKEDIRISSELRGPKEFDVQTIIHPDSST